MYLGKNDSLRLEFIGKNLFDYMVGNDQKATLMPLYIHCRYKYDKLDLVPLPFLIFLLCQVCFARVWRVFTVLNLHDLVC